MVTLGVKHYFLIIFALLSGASAALYWTAPEQQNEMPVL
jgi:hypothetical protein